MELTTVHKIRLFFGLVGQEQDGNYLFSVPSWGGYKTKVIMFKFMDIIGNPILNVILKGKWKK